MTNSCHIQEKPKAPLVEHREKHRLQIGGMGKEHGRKEGRREGDEDLEDHR
jgi:hypothetical protein